MSIDNKGGFKKEDLEIGIKYSVYPYKKVNLIFYL
jgi:hypothetical protein